MAEFEVREIGSITPSSHPTKDIHISIFTSGRIQLVNVDDFDFDNGQQSDDNTNDIVFGKADSEMIIAAINGA